jgi:hypothetical protein
VQEDRPCAYFSLGHILQERVTKYFPILLDFGSVGYIKLLNTEFKIILPEFSSPSYLMSTYNNNKKKGKAVPATGCRGSHVF